MKEIDIFIFISSSYSYCSRRKIKNQVKNQKKLLFCKFITKKKERKKQ
jgi:hypothetical protein